MENRQKNSRKRLNSLILLVAFTAIMLIVSTYAWFSAQKNVTLGGLQGIVRVAEGLEISLDAKHWSQEVDFGKFTDQDDLKKQYGISSTGTPSGNTYDDKNLSSDDVEHNLIPEELLPVSTTGTSTNGIGLKDMNMYRGIVSSGLDATGKTVTNLTEVISVLKDTTSFTDYEETDTVATPAHHDYSGYYAIDFFLRNSTRTSEAGKDQYSEILQLNTNSKLTLINTNSLSTGLQNTVRVAFAGFKAAGGTPTVAEGVTPTAEDWTNYLNQASTTASNYMTANQSQILNAYYNQDIRDVAIWEPNTSDHVQYIVDNNPSTPEFSKADTILYIDDDYGTNVAAAITAGLKGLKGSYVATEVADDPTVEFETGAMRTYALTSAAKTATKVDDIYDWATPASGLAAQVALQTEKKSESDYAIADGVKNLVSVTAPSTTKYVSGAEDGVVNFKIGDGTVAKIRMYVWLEGQDIDCVNYASHGGGIDLDIGLLKDGEVGQS